MPMTQRWRPFAGTAALLLAILLVGGCHSTPLMLAPEQRRVIDRRDIEYPAGTELTLLATGLTAPSAIAFDVDGSLLIAESGIDDNPAKIFGFTPKGEFFEVWPRGKRFLLERDFLQGPIGGMIVAHGGIYVTHRDNEGRGMVTRFDREGNHKTIVAGLPARGDHAVTDIAVAKDGRLFFGVGSATNSGVVGLDNLSWLRQYPRFCDEAWTDRSSNWLYLTGLRFNTRNPFAGIFGGDDVAVTAPFQSFGQSIETRIGRVSSGKPSAAIYSVDPDGGDMKVEAWGIRNPVGLGFNEFGRLYLTNQGMKMRGTRPVKDDPDVLLRMVHGQWYGWPDFSTNLLPILDPRFQPPQELLVRSSGYRELAFVVDQSRSNLSAPTQRSEDLLAGEFQPLSGAAKFDFVPASGPLARLRQRRDMAVVALCGDRAPWDSGGMPLVGPIGYKLVAVRIERGTGQVEEFIRNTYAGPYSGRDRAGRGAIGLERPCDVKFGPDGALYILDFGQMRMKGSRQQVTVGTGRIFKLTGLAESPK